MQTSLAEAVLAGELLDIELSKKYDKQHQLVSVVKFLCQKYQINMDHAENVSQLCDQLFDGLRDSLGLQPDERLYLTLSAYLHDIGAFVHNRSHHKHTEYIINAWNLFRMDDEEIKVIAAIARYHRRALPRKAHINYNSLSLQKQLLVQKLSAILRVANALDATHRQKIKKVDISVSPGLIKLTISPVVNVILEQLAVNENKTMLERVSGSQVKLKIKDGMSS